MPNVRFILISLPVFSAPTILISEAGGWRFGGKKGPKRNLGLFNTAMNFVAEGSQTKYIDLHEAEESTLAQIKVLVFTYSSLAT